jgi:hypothetical protein
MIDCILQQLTRPSMQKHPRITRRGTRSPDSSLPLAPCMATTDTPRRMASPRSSMVNMATVLLLHRRVHNSHQVGSRNGTTARRDTTTSSKPPAEHNGRSLVVGEALPLHKGVPLDTISHTARRCRVYLPWADMMKTPGRTMALTNRGT